MTVSNKVFLFLFFNFLLIIQTLVGRVAEFRNARLGYFFVFAFNESLSIEMRISDRLTH